MRIAYAALAIVAVGAAPAAPARAWPGNAVVRNGQLSWGQYRTLTGAVAVAFPAAVGGGTLPDRIKDYPTSGASAVLLFCQEPGRPFFSPDGKTIVEARLAELRRQLNCVCKFDLLPLVVLLDPAPSCRLQSIEAYEEAVQTLLRGVGSGVWFLACVSDRCDAPQWRQGAVAVEPVRLVKRLVAILRQRRPGQAVAAGGSTAVTNARLVQGAAPVDVVARRVQRLQFEQAGSPAAAHPVLDVAAASSIDQAVLRQAIGKVGVQRRAERFPYGLAVHFQDLPRPRRAQARDRFLKTLQAVTDQAQKDLCAAVPLDPADQSSLKPGEAAEGFISLFNGKDLSGWVSIAADADFVVKDGVLQTARMQGGHVRSWNRYGDFVFRGEYWIEAGGNSGFFVRAPLVGRCSRIGFEVQIRGQQRGPPVNKDSNGAIYDVRPPLANFGKPNAWNDVEITCIGTEVTVKTNGKVGHHFKYEDIEFARGRSTRGFIGLQDHHHLVKFRNLRIKPLAPPATP